MIQDVSELRVGVKVRYQPKHYARRAWENGLIKEIRENCFDAVWVVYNCNGQWADYRNYTGAKTKLEDLHMGWKF